MSGYYLTIDEYSAARERHDRVLDSYELLISGT